MTNQSNANWKKKGKEEKKNVLMSTIYLNLVTKKNVAKILKLGWAKYNGTQLKQNKFGPKPIND